MIVIFHNGQENENAYLTLWRWEISCSQIDNDIFGNCGRYNDDYGNDVHCFEEITAATQKKLRLEIISKNEGYSYVLGNIIIVITTMVSSK